MTLREKVPRFIGIMEKDTSLCQAHANCSQSFSNLISALGCPARDFNDDWVSLNGVVMEFERYRQWAAKSGAEHPVDRGNISLDYHLGGEEESFYKTQVCW